MAGHECCIFCDNLTGKAGRGDDSLYTDDGKGPFCESCFDAARIAELEARIADLEQLLTDQSRQIEELEADLKDAHGSSAALIVNLNAELTCARSPEVEKLIEAVVAWVLWVEDQGGGQAGLGPKLQPVYRTGLPFRPTPAPTRTERLHVLLDPDTFGCFSGDCPHDRISECIEAIEKELRHRAVEAAEGE